MVRGIITLVLSLSCIVLKIIKKVLELWSDMWVLDFSDLVD